MKMRNKYVGDLAAPDLVIDHLYLCTLATIHQEIVSIHCHHLAGRMAVKSWYCRIISKDSYSEHEAKIQSIIDENDKDSKAWFNAAFNQISLMYLLYHTGSFLQKDSGG